MRNHGGDIARIAAQYGIAPEDLLDFSANINPRGLPHRARERLIRDAANPSILEHYPDPHATELSNALAQRLNIDPVSVTIGAGAESLIAAAIRASNPRTCLLPIPAFSEYARVFPAMTPLPLDPNRNFELKVASHADLLILNNPHNPSGTAWPRATISAILDDARGFVLLDEAFIDYCPELSFTRDGATRPRTVAIRSLTKFYGCPSLRVGYCVADPDFSQRIRDQLPTWPVTTLALNAAVEMIADTEYEQASRFENAIERERLRSQLMDAGFTVSPSSTNFLLIRLSRANSGDLCRRAIERHRIMIRNCDSFEGLERGHYIRVAVRTRPENHRLLDALVDCKNP